MILFHCFSPLVWLYFIHLKSIMQYVMTNVTFLCVYISFTNTLSRLLKSSSRRYVLLSLLLCITLNIWGPSANFTSGSCHDTILINVFFLLSVQARIKSPWFVCGWLNCSTVTASVWCWQGRIRAQILEELHRYLSKPLPLPRGW